MAPVQTLADDLRAYRLCVGGGDAAAALDASRGTAEVTNIDQLIQRIGNWLQDPNARKSASDAGQKTVARLGGALDRTVAALEPYLLQLRLERRVADA